MGGSLSLDDEPAPLVLIIGAGTGSRVGVGATDVAMDVETPIREEQLGGCNSFRVDYRGGEMYTLMHKIIIKL